MYNVCHHALCISIISRGQIRCIIHEQKGSNVHQINPHKNGAFAATNANSLWQQDSSRHQAYVYRLQMRFIRLLLPKLLYQRHVGISKIRLQMHPRNDTLHLMYTGVTGTANDTPQKNTDHGRWRCVFSRPHTRWKGSYLTYTGTKVSRSQEPQGLFFKTIYLSESYSRNSLVPTNTCIPVGTPTVKSTMYSERVCWNPR